MPGRSGLGRLGVSAIPDISARKETELRLQASLTEVQRLKDRIDAENRYLREEISRSSDSREIVGESPSFKLALEKTNQVARTDTAVLITGETGTGKGLIAQAIHDRSSRKDPPLIKVNCSALPASLMESELFGHEAGAFTGATARKIGRFELARGGTIFLDEIGELQPELQVKLLRVLQDGEIERIGSSTTISVDARVVAATNRDLRQAMREERFRRDLYFRLAVFPIDVPPLRVRRDDIPLLVWHFVAKKRARLGRKIEKVSYRTMEKLAAYSWPGNVRELENVVERAMIISRDSTLAIDELLGDLDEPRDPPAISATFADVERAHIARVLDDCNWRIKGKGNAADRLDMPPSTLRYRMKKLGVDRPQPHPNRTDRAGESRVDSPADVIDRGSSSTNR